MDHSIVTDNGKKKPEIVSFYNNTKYGVDLLNMKCTIYATNKRTRHWPMAIFLILLCKHKWLYIILMLSGIANNDTILVRKGSHTGLSLRCSTITNI